MIEVWTECNEDPRYKVSTFGRVMGPSGKVLSPAIEGKGYERVKFSYGRGVPLKGHLVHRLVASNFLARGEGKTQVNHRDGRKTNNAVWNLEWVSGSENMKHAIRTGLRSRFWGIHEGRGTS